MKIIVPSDYENELRLDKYLAENTSISRSQISKMVNLDIVLVNQKNAKASHKIKAGDIIEFDEKFLIESPLIEKEIDLDIVYEDEYLMIVNKPSGLVVHPGSGNKNNTLVNGLMYYTKHLSNIGGESRPGIVHRIDKNTSGLLVVAKDNKTHALLAKMFSKKEIKRKYIALIKGVFPNLSATIDAPIGRDIVNRKQMSVTAQNSKSATTHFKVLKRYQKFTLIELLLETGRTHQIRVHLKYIGFPIYNDPVYSDKDSTDFGQFLHSASVEFIHPITKEAISISCNLPKEFQDFTDQLK